MIHRVTVVLPVSCLCVTNTLLVVWEYGTSAVLYFLFNQCVTSGNRYITSTLALLTSYAGISCVSSIVALRYQWLIQGLVTEELRVVLPALRVRNQYQLATYDC